MPDESSRSLKPSVLNVGLRARSSPCSSTVVSEVRISVRNLFKIH